MRVFVATEGQICWLPGVELDDVPEGLPPSVSFFTRSGMVGVKFDGVVGSVGLQSGDVIQVNPKIGDVNFLKLVAFTTGGDSLIEKISQSTKYSFEEGQQLSSLVAEEFLDCAEGAMRFGLQHARQWQNHAGREVRGRIDLVLTEQRIVVAHDRPVVSKVRMRTFDTPENRLAAAALLVAEALVPENRRNDILRLRRRWPCTSSSIERIIADLDAVERGMLQNEYRGVRDYYRELMGLSLVVLNIGGLGHGSDQFLGGRTFLVNTANVFETFILRAVQNSLSGREAVVTKGGTEFRSLYLDGTFQMEPDVVIEKFGKCVGIIDAKYKFPTSGDHYQMMSYIENFGVNSGALFRPTFSNEMPGIERLKSVSGKEVAVLRLDLANLDGAINDIQKYVLSIV